MSFRDTRQRAAVCRALCAFLGQPDLWDPLEPTERARELAMPGPSPLSPAERVLLSCAWDVWSGTGHAFVADVIRELDQPRTLAIAEMLSAIVEGPGAIDSWLQTYQPPVMRKLRAPDENRRPR